VGYRIAGIWGALSSLLGIVIPSFAIILLVAIFFADIRDNKIVDSAFKAMRPAVVALIVAPIVGLSKGLNPWLLVVAAVTAVAIWWFGFSPIYVLVVAAVAGLVWSLYLVRKEGKR
jgi:chromate transporter